MKNFTNNFKQFTSRLSARWLIFALMMLVGTSSVWAATTIVYLSPSTNWKKDGARFAARFWSKSDGSDEKWVSMTLDGSYYKCDVPSGLTKVIFCRMNGSTSTNNWDNKWNQTGDLTLGTNNLFTVNNSAWDGHTTGWSCYPSSVTTTYNLDGSSGTTVTLSGSQKGLDYNLYKDGTLVSGQAKAGSGSALSWTISSTGTYTIKASNSCKSATAMSGSYAYNPCTPKDPTFVHTNSSYEQISTPTYYLGDKAYFKSTINCCLTGNWTKDGDGTYKTLTGSTPNFNLILSGVGSFTLTNNATDGCSGTTTPSISFTTKDLPVPTSQSGTGSTTSATLSWSPNNTYKTVMVVRYAKDAAVTAPTQGTAYTAGSSKIGNGTVVYKGTGTSYTNTGLTAGNSYDYYFYTVNNNYYSTSVKTTVSTCTSLTAPTLTITPITKCKDTYTSGKIVIEGYDPNTYTYVLKKGATPVNKTYNDGYIIANGEQGDYTVIMDLKAGGSCKSVESTGSVNIVDNTPVVETLTMPANFSSCDGQLVQGIALQNWNEADGYTYTYQWQSSANGTSFTNMGGMTSSGMTPLLNGTTWYRVKVTKSKDGCTSLEKISDAVTVTANSLSEPTVSIASASYDMNAKTFTVSGRLGDAGCSQEIEVGYRYKLSNDDTWSDLIKTHDLTEAGIFTKEGISIAGATAGQTYLFQTYAKNGYPNETSVVLSSSTIEVEVQDGYTVYVRRPKSGDDTNVYTNWYELSSVKGGAPYVKSGPIQGSSANGQNKATTNNTGGTEMTYAFTDCDGYIWDSFKPAKDQTQFHIHALNNDKQDGWGTFSKTATITAGKDNYFYLSGWSSGTYGVTITSTSQPTRGVRIKVLGSTEVISTNMASFAAISFNGNCTGKELLKDAEGDPTGFQWKYSTDGASWSNYTGTGATWNNIRPTAEGKYKLVCTMEDMTTVESNEVEITTTSKNYSATDLINIKSKLPIIMVNTGDNNGFPACSVAGSDYPSKHADKFKKKLSVDVKIKVGDNIVYDKKARMAYRGSSSLNFKKKSYAFCPGADMCGLDEDKSPDYVDTKKIDMLDLITGGTKKSAKDKDWVLYAATPDPSMMRNILAMETFSAMTGKWGVKNQYVELYVDGVYQGVYVFMDKITQNKGRVNVEWKVDGSSKGFIVKFDKTDLADRYEIPNGDQKTFESAMKTGNTGVISYGTEIDQRFEIEYPEKEDVIDDGGSWADVYTFVKGKIDAFESALKDGDFNTVRTIIDYESWADFFILTEFAKNGDGYRASCVFVYEGGLLKAYPLWDYELSFDNETRQEHGIDSKEGLLVKQTTYSKVSGGNGTFPAPFWWTGNYYNQKTYKGLLDDPCFVAMVKARLTKHTTGEGALTKTKMQKLVDAYNTALTTTDGTTTYNTPQKREALKWPYNGTTRGLTCNSKDIGYYGKGAGSASSVEEDFSGSKSTLDAWIGDSGRRGGLSTEIDNLAKDITFAITVVADKTTTTPWRPVTVTVNSNSGYEYSITPEPAKLEENGHMYTLYFARPEGTVGTNFDTKNEFYTFTATTGQADQCGTTQGSTTSAEVKIDLADVVENCPQP